ncbi:MAG TPA: hypothetical protein EYG92_02330 [Lutibacter sp.]|nr:hypothetical protein [Lutibacter sp.]
MRKLTLLVVFLTFLVQSCAVKKEFQQSINTYQLQNYFTGLLVVNTQSKDTLINYNSQKYFTPASTTKLFTLYTSLKSLPDSIATISYFDLGDKRYFKALADPTFLVDSLPNSTYGFLKNTDKELIFVSEEFSDFIYGDGWQWDDFQYYYMPEKSLFPIYSNLVSLENNRLTPKHFQQFIQKDFKKKYYRDFLQNDFYIDSIPSGKRRFIPFKTSLELSLQLLSDTLHKPIYKANEIEEGNFKPYISTPIRPIYDRLMQQSDNFIAEYLFLIISKNKTDSYQVKNSIQYALDSLLHDIPDKPRWVDASGLSRYNLFTPRSMVYLLHKLYNDFGEEKVFDLLPKNGEGETLQNNYPFDTTYIYAKTGTVSNNHNLCGFIKTQKGTLLTFSFMNNHYLQKNSETRKEMNQLLQKLYYNY